MRLIMAYSKEDQVAYSKAYREANKEKIAAYCKAWREANKEKALASQKAYRESNKEKVAASQKAWCKSNEEKVAAYQKSYYESNKKKVEASQKAWCEANKEKIAATKKDWYEANKEKISTTKKAYRESNPNKINADASRRRALKLKLIPKHLKKCPVEKQRLLDIYKLSTLISKATGIEYHVDHMWPMSDKGPHWSGNLQIITAHENLTKHASVDLELKHNIQQSLKETM